MTLRLNVFLAVVVSAAFLSPIALGGGPPAPPKGTVPNSVCADCHEQEAKTRQSAHAKVPCSGCHLKHEEYPHPENAPQPQCKNCHAASVSRFETSEHAAQIRKGNQMAPDCSSCHGDVHEAKSGRTAEFHTTVPETCGMCHDKVSAEFAASVHGKALAAGVRAAPDCTDCHGSHEILKHTNPRSSVFSTAVPDTCGRCHGDVRLMARFGLPADRITSFETSFHGLALKSGSQTVADCSSCHGVHNILPSSDPKSMTHQKNLAATCGKCHPGAGSRFALGPVHEVENKNAAVPWVGYATWFYLLVIPGTLGFMFVHHAGDLVRKLATMRFQGRELPMQVFRTVDKAHVRMHRMERIQHMLLAVSFIALAYTGFALHYPDHWWARPIVAFEGNYPLRGAVHRTAGVILIATSILHLVTLIVNRVLREHWRELLPVWGDLRELVEGTLWRLGLRKERPRQSAHSYIEKIEYWALIWGTAIMAITGLMLWFNNWTLTFLPKVAIDLARVIHFYEAVLATAAIVIWHFYSVIFDPEVYPMDPAWITGFSPRVSEDRGRHGD